MKRSEHRGDTARTIVDDTKLSLEGGVCGFIGTVVMTLFLYLAPALGLSSMPLPALFGHWMTGGGPDVGFAHAMGWVMHFALGVGLAVLFAWIVERFEPEHGAGTGALFSLGPWLALQTVVLPLAGDGVFGANTGHGPENALVTLVAFLAWGAVMGGLLRIAVERTAIPMIESRVSRNPRRPR